MDHTMSLRVLKAVFQMQKDYLTTKRKKGGKNVKLPAIRSNITRLFGISPNTYALIVNEYLKHRTIYATGKNRTGRVGNRREKITRVPRTNLVQVKVREWVRQRRAQRIRTTARQVLDFLVDEKILVVTRDDGGKYHRKALTAGLRSVQRWLVSMAYRRGKRTGNIIPDVRLVLRRHQYLTAFFANRALPEEERLREVYMDESYIHEHYHRNDDSIWDPSDEQDIQQSKERHKGRRYCFACAIQGSNPRIANEIDGNGPGIVPGSVWAFCPQKKEQHQGDYHKVFNGVNFVAWWRNQLLPNLTVPSLIILDNARYHLVKPVDTPRPHKMKKQECLAFLGMKGLLEEGMENETALQLKQRVKDWVEANVPVEIVRLAEEAGHKVLFTPPYHSDLQLIELLWAQVKGNVGRQYSSRTTISIVYERLMQEFRNLEEDGEPIGRMVEKCARIAQEFYDQAEEDNLDDDEEEEEDDDNGSDVEVGDDDPGTIEPTIEGNDDDEEGQETESVDGNPISYVENVETV